jgi:hypothetical protein
VVAEDTNVTLDEMGNEVVNNYLSLFAAAPVAGQYQIVYSFANPIGGDAVRNAFTGHVVFDSLVVTSTVANSESSSVSATSGATATITVTSNGYAPLLIGADPRTSTNATYDLGARTQAFNDQPLWFVPPSTSSVTATMTSTVPAAFDFGNYTGDPDLSPLVPMPDVTSTQAEDNLSSSLTYAPSTGVASGLYYLKPGQIGPFYATGQGTGSTTADVSVVTKAFDPEITTDAGNVTTALLGFGPNRSQFATLVNPDQTITITVNLAPTDAVGTVESGSIAIESVSVGGILPSLVGSSASDLASTLPWVSTLDTVP